MSSSRSESVYSRRARSNTAQSILRPVPVPPTPLQVGDSRTFTLWVHDPKESSSVIINQVYWPGVAEGDMLSIAARSGAESEAFLFMVPKDEGCSKPQLQLSIPKHVAETFGLKNHGEVIVTKVDKEKYCAEYVEFIFQDQYLGRNDMWRMGEHLVGQCVYTKQDISFIGSIAATIQNIHIGDKTVSSAYMTTRTKAIYRSLSAKVTIFIQVCHELWEFASDGERYNEKIVHSFLPALFTKWKEAGCNHTVTIVLISRVYYDPSEVDYAAGPMRQGEDGERYKDFYKVITDLEVNYEWKPTLVSLKNSFWDFQRDILLTHHYHRATKDLDAEGPADQVRLVGRLSYAHDGPILEALNLGLNPSETHYIDRSLTSTGASTILITPGSGYFRVSKQLLRLTTTRMLDHGFGLELICLGKPPLHQSPIFSFTGTEAVSQTERGTYGSRVSDHLWGGDDDSGKDSPVDGTKARGKTVNWWEPFWISVSFWDRQMDLPFRRDRFVAKAKMHELQMLGLLENDVLASIEVPFLPDQKTPAPAPMHDQVVQRKFAADQFDLDVFALQTSPKAVKTTHRNSVSSATSGINPPPTPRAKHVSEGRRPHRDSTIVTPTIQAIAETESPLQILPNLPLEGTSETIISSSTGLSSSPSQLSLKSKASRSPSRAPSQRSTRSSKDPTSLAGTLSSKLTPSWLFKPFRSNPAEPQVSNLAAAGSPTRPASLGQATTALTLPTPTSSPVRVPPKLPISPSPRPTNPVPLPSSTKSSPQRLSLSRTLEDDYTLPNRKFKRSPVNTPPRDDSSFGKRRSGLTISFTSSSPVYLSNPSKPRNAVPRQQASLAARWQHIFPRPLYKHEIKWKSLITPACLPLTTEYFPSTSELETSYNVNSYDFVVDPKEMRSFLVKPPVVRGTEEEKRRAWALVVMRGMAAVRLAQGFQFVLRSPENDDPDNPEGKVLFRRNKSFIMEQQDMAPRPRGASEVLTSTAHAIYLSMSNEIHRIAYTGEAIQVRRYVRKMPPTRSFNYKCLIWPKLGVGYTELQTTFTSHGLEGYGWNRLDMLVAGYEQQFNESLRYWRTRFVVIPASVPQSYPSGSDGAKLDDEEVRILGIEKLAEQFTKVRWQSPEEKKEREKAASSGSTSIAPPPPTTRFLPTTLSPAFSVLDDTLMEQLDQIHAFGPLRKKMKSEKEIGNMAPAAIAKAMREEGAVMMRTIVWHRARYQDSFTGYDLVSWLVREFRDVSSRAQGAEWGVRLLEEFNLIEHCRGFHSFLDGHYIYRLKGEFAIISTPRLGWFGRRQPAAEEMGTPRSSFNYSRGREGSRFKKRLILSQSMVIDIDQNGRSDQAETVILHHDIIHNPATVFHFELQWIGTTARYIDDQVRQWNKTIERYGLKLVEAYVTQISDVRERNAFQSCFPVRLALPPPPVPERHLADGTPLSQQHFEYAVLRKFDFIVDVEAAQMYPPEFDIVYSYRRSPFKYSQFVHRSGVAFVQVLGGADGFLFLTNRLMGSSEKRTQGPGSSSLKNKEMQKRPAVAADQIRQSLHRFCSNKEELRKLYDEELAYFGGPEEPPPLSI